MAQTSSAALEASIVPTPLLSFNLNKLLIFVQQSAEVVDSGFRNQTAVLVLAF
jgi:hypothetical protein